MALPTQARLNDHLMRWDKEIKSFEIVVNEYGQKKADMDYRRAVVMETAKVDDTKLSQASAERMADADAESYRLHKEFRSAESSISAKKERLRWCSAVSDALRSEVSTERSEAHLYAADRSTP